MYPREGLLHLPALKVELRAWRHPADDRVEHRVGVDHRSDLLREPVEGDVR
jgi:hypothetical protein